MGPCSRFGIHIIKGLGFSFHYDTFPYDHTFYITIGCFCVFIGLGDDYGSKRNP